MNTNIPISDDDRRLLIETVSSLVAAKIEPLAKQIDQEGEIAGGIFSALAESGLHAVNVPAVYGGEGASIADGVVLIEELARGCASVASILVMNLAGIAALVASKNERLKSELLPHVAKGEVILVWSAEAWEDQGELTATPDSDGLVLSGKLHWVPCFEVGAKLMLVARAKAQSESHLVVIDLSTPQNGLVEIGPLESDLGLRGTFLRTVSLQSANIKKDQIIASGFDVSEPLQRLRSVGQVATAAQANGLASASLGHARRYVSERYQFGVPISDFESTRIILATMALNLAAARQLTFAAADKLGAIVPVWADRDRIAADCGAKWFATKVAVDVAIDTVQLFGGYGFVKDYPVERLMRDAKMTQLMLGTNQILDIADEMLSR